MNTDRLWLVAGILSLMVGCGTNAPPDEPGGSRAGLAAKLKVEVTFTATATETATTTRTATATQTNTQTQTATVTETSTDTYTATAVETSTYTETSTSTQTQTATESSTYTATGTTTQSETFTQTSTYAQSSTHTQSSTATQTVLMTSTYTQTATATGVTATPTVTATGNVTGTASGTFTGTIYYISPVTYSRTVTSTAYANDGGNVSGTASNTTTATYTSGTLTVTDTTTAAGTVVAWVSGTGTNTLTVLANQTTASQTVLRTSTATGTGTGTITYAQTGTTTTSTLTSSSTDTTIITEVQTLTETSTATQTDTLTRAFTTPATNTLTETSTVTQTLTPTATNTLTSTATITQTLGGTATQVITETGTQTTTATSTLTQTQTPTATAAASGHVTGTASGTFTATVYYVSPLTYSRTVTSTAYANDGGNVSGTASNTTTATHISGTLTVTGTTTATGTIYAWVSGTGTNTLTVLANQTTASRTILRTNTATGTGTGTITFTRTQTATATATSTATDRVTSTAVGTVVATSTVTNIATITTTVTSTVTNTTTDTATNTLTVTSTSTETSIACSQQNWANTDCGQFCTGQTQEDRQRCNLFLDCYFANNCSPAACGGQDDVCGVNRPGLNQWGVAPKVVADEVWKCMGCPGSVDCASPPKPNGTLCADGNACTEHDTCQSGVCVGEVPAACTASDQCHDAGTCNPTTGLCSNPARPGTPPCDDNDACTQTDLCVNGVCTGTAPVVCTATDQCHDVGTCDPATGSCSSPPKTGTDCSDGDACTQGDQCQEGTCLRGADVVCLGDQCNVAGTCDPATGACSSTPLSGTPCDDGQSCTQDDTCQAGVCVSGPPAVVTDLTATSLSEGLRTALAWAPFPGATSYNVKRATTSGGPYTTIASPTVPEYMDNDFSCLIANYYVVTAISDCGESPASAEVSSAPEQYVVPTALCVNRFSETSWNAVFGYTNNSLCAATIPTGPINRLEPGSPGSPNLPTTFAPGVTRSMFVASFPGGSLTWTLGAGQATATESLPRCSIGDLPLSSTPPLLPGAGETPSMPSQAGWTGFEPDVVGPFSQSGTLAWAPSGRYYQVQGGLPNGLFEFLVRIQKMGEDWGVGAETDIDVAILDENGTILDQANYNNPDDWHEGFWYAGSWPVAAFVDPSVPYVIVRVSMNEHDYENTEHWVRRLKVDNVTGDVVAVMDDQNQVLQAGPLTTPCADSNGDGWGFCWMPVKVTGGRPRLCVSLLAEYLDSKYGQSHLEPEPSATSRVQKVPAAFAYARYRIESNVKAHTIGGPVPWQIPERTVNASSTGHFALDQDGCVPDNLLSIAREDVQFDTSGKLEIELRVRSEFCHDPGDTLCRRDPNDGALTTSGTRFGVYDRDGKIREWCVILTSDELRTDPECEVVHRSEGAFARWAHDTWPYDREKDVRYAPLEINITPSTHDANTRVAGVVATIYKRALESPDLVGAFFQPGETKKGIYAVFTDTFRRYGNIASSEHPERRVLETESQFIGPSFECAEGEAMGDCAYWLPESGRDVWTPCQPGPSAPNCRPSLSYFKTAVAHEIGHQVQRLNGSIPDPMYDLELPGLPRLCACDHVQFGNRIHCPQSAEDWGAGMLEGYAHAFAAAVMNADSGTPPCVFLYQKEIVDETCVAANGEQDCSQVEVEGVSHPVFKAKTPIRVGCQSVTVGGNTPGLWRNRHCGQGATSADVVADMVVELDMMGFLRAISNTGAADQRISNSAFLEVMKGKYAEDIRVSWEGGGTNQYSYREEILQEIGGGNDQDPRYQSARMKADEYGVSRNTNLP